EKDFELLRKRKSCSLLTRDQMLEGKVPTTPTTSSIIAGIECQEAVKLLHNRKELPVLSGAGFYFNGMTHDSFIVRYQRKEDCLSHDTFEAIEETDWKASTLCVGDLMEHVRSLMGTEAVVDIEREVVIALDCLHCQTSEPMFVVQTKLTESQARCPSCGEIRIPRMMHSFDNCEAYADRTLEQMGIPALDIVTGRVGMTRRHFELSGDSDQVLGPLSRRDTRAVNI
ncbi:MAG: ThiF family adenylyltransferase, partial [bacterium]